MNKLFFIFLVIFISVSLYSVEEINISTFFSKEDISKLDNGELISRMYVKFNAKKENTDENIPIPQTKYNNEDFSIYEVVTDEKVFIPFELTDQSKLQFYNTLTSYSKLKGMVYYSRRAGKVEELIKKCYRVESLSETSYPDINYNQILPKVSNMFLQKDNKLGTLTFRSEIYNEADNFVMVNTCIEPITVGLLTINNSEEYKIYSFFFYDKEKKGFYYYTFQALRVNDNFILKLGVLAPTTFSNRLRASTVHLAKLLGIDWTNKLNPWVNKYDKY
ncbi:MAG: hypothetical protein A2086_05035 [Spirochaetes bacterium GWD1_27_9]|nr:MAG: hypothetical protein A2Z98_10610 [Spirochaetes bacterium GWB1_27_13]OHD26223.1 MAG: hypothetical protein A2Y34_11195 [Spirochaetes bacterium GWC1_27_15]OHD44584.1 MAG: hypothetical protein A2086_05035 [Spirochaetes bacterium GWD1_27_9]